MNFELTQPKHLISLASSSLIVSVDVNVWTATKQDRKIANEVTASKNADADAGRFTKNLLSHSPQHKALLNYRQTVYNWLQRCTYDWNGSARIIPTFKVEKLMKEFSAHEVAFNDLLDKFEAAYPSLVSDAAFKQGSMFDISEYPDVSQLRSKFRIRLFTHPVPADDFRTGGIASAIADDLKKHYENQVQDIVNQVMDDATQRMLSYATRLRNACEEVKAEADEEAKSGKTKRRKIYEATFENVREMSELLKHFNLTNNPEIEQARMKLEQALTGVSLSDLRESAYTRATVKDDLDDVLKMFAPINLDREEE
jgi:hypothetical protein